MKQEKEKAFKKEKHGIELWAYDIKNTDVGLVYVEVKEGHFQEFYDKESTFIYYIIEGSGSYFLDGKEVKVKAGDVLEIPPKTKIYYLGNMKLVLVTTPAWKAENEVHIRYIENEK